MRDGLTALTVALGLAALVPHGAGAFAQPAPGQNRPLALVGGTIYASPSDAPIPDGVVLIRRDRVAAAGRRRAVSIPNDSEIVDISGQVVAAGFWNSHVHFTERKWAKAAAIPAPELSAQLEAMLTRYGFTSVFDTGSAWENTRGLRHRIEAGAVRGPRIRSTGEVLFPDGGTTSGQILDVVGAMRIRMPEVSDPAAAQAMSKQLLDAGADGIKLYAATWAPPIVALPEAAIRAAVAEAHARGKPVFAHPSNREGLLAAVRGGVDILVHTAPQAGPWDDVVLSAMKERRVALIPTLKLWRYELRHDRISALERFSGAGVSQLRTWLAADGDVLFGTDVGYMSDYDPSDEYALMAEAGMTARQILASLTTAPAERFGASKDLGRIAPGFIADLVVLREDPFKSVRAFAGVRYTIRDGKFLYRPAQ